MKAIIKPGRSAGLTLAEVSLPVIGPQDVLVKVLTASICGSDIPIYSWDDPWVQATVQPGQIIGHEFCGVVTQLGSNVSNTEIGELVTAEGHINCGYCFQCRTGQAHLCPNVKLIGFDYPGAFAEYIAVPSVNLVSLPKLPLTLAAIQDPFGNAIHATTGISLTGETVLITGCGPIGLMTIALAKHAGAHYILATDTSLYRRNLASKMGADYVLDPQEPDIAQLIRDKTSLHSGVDVLLEMSGASQALTMGFQVTRNGGQARLLGLPKEPIMFDFSNDLIVKGITVYGVCGRKMFGTWDQALRFMERREDGAWGVNLLPLITHQLLIDDYEKGMELMSSRECGKIILFMDEMTLSQSLAEERTNSAPN